MLVLSRQRDETIDVGGEGVAMVMLSPLERGKLLMLREYWATAGTDPLFVDLVDRLLRPATVEITVVDIRGDKVRLGITAAKEIPIHRREVAEAIRRERRGAAATTAKPAATAGAVATPSIA